MTRRWLSPGDNYSGELRPAGKSGRFGRKFEDGNGDLDSDRLDRSNHIGSGLTRSGACSPRGLCLRDSLNTDFPAFKYGRQGRHAMRIEPLSHQGMDDLQGVVWVMCRLIRPIRGQRVEGLSQGDDARQHGDLVILQATGIAPPI